VEQALPYYKRFIGRFPTISDLAEADEEEVLALWAGLGYYARARNMLKAARQIVNRHHAAFPRTMEEALELPGIGSYTAAAILSIAYHQPWAVVDGNVIRVISRLLALRDDVRQASVKRRIEAVSQDLIDPSRPGAYNEAVMELGATICKPKKPDCAACPVQTFCLAQKQELQEVIPFKSAVGKKKSKKQLVFAVKRNGQLLIVKRPSEGLLGSMWEFPSLESHRLTLSGEELRQQLKRGYGISGRILHVSEPLKHSYSHFSLTYRPVLVEMEEGEVRVTHHVDWRWQAEEEFRRIPLHRAHLKIFEWIQKLEVKTKR